MITLVDYLSLSAALFSIGVAGIFINRKNMVSILMCLELLLISVCTNFLAFSYYLADIKGQIFVLFILAAAAAEAAIGLSLLVALFRSNKTINVDEMSFLKG